MTVPTNIQKALVACKSCPHMPQLSLACESNPCPNEAEIIGYVADAPDDPCSTCIFADTECDWECEYHYSMDA
jgi:hypothetical protein